MPQDIPLEASDTLVFKNHALKHIEGAPTFLIRTATWREKRHVKVLNNEEGVRRYSGQQIREAIVEGLQALWSPETFETQYPVLQSLWDARDEFELQKADNPDLEWEFDPEVEEACAKLTVRVSEAYPPLRRMLAANADAQSMSGMTLTAVMLKGWTGLTTAPDLDRGYLSMDCVHALQDEIRELEQQHGIEPGTVWTELFAVCSVRMFLDEEAVKNFVSPSPSEETPPASSETTECGTSPASANSSEETPPAAEPPTPPTQAESPATPASA